MKPLFIKAYAKVNLSLDVCGKRQDGYHELRSVMQQISLADDLWAEPAEKVSLSCNLPYIPTDERNIVCKAAKAFFDYTGIHSGVRFTLHKRVPSGAGLGGGSGDGAAAVKLLDKMYGTGLSREQMAEIVAPIGADLPFFMYGGTALAEGIGEKLTPLTPLAQGAFLLLKPKFSLSTPIIFSALDTLADYPHPDADKMMAALSGGSLQEVADAMGNSMQCAVVKTYPVIDTFCRKLKDAGAMGAVMSGSGSTVYGLFGSVADAKKAALSLISPELSVYIAVPVCE
ncbi:MAG: 4-(cytidine 5'-diphospho)-2-C-methyl-D-erythritol kinase [Clostridia bacterium]|nr:4-(cytidine 5'-diphospho)-2-C-methyl-D-erythritol kinase [Clostridia bacterium]